MADRYLIGVDIGTTGSKGVLVDPEGGKVLAYQFREHAVSTPRPGWCEQDADDVWWADLSAILRALLAQSGVDPKTVAGVGISALSPDLLPLDEVGRPLYKGILYSDMRAAAEIGEITAQLGQDRIVRSSGRPLPPDSVGAKIVWLRKNEPQVFQRTRHIHTAASYLVFRLTGEHAIDPLSASGFSPLFDWGGMCWREDIARDLGLRTDVLPKPRASTDVAGAVTRQAAAETGLAVGTPVMVSAVDALAEFVSTGAVSPGEASLLYGTTMIMGIIVPPPSPGSRLMPMPFGPAGLLGVGITMSASGALTRWFRDNFGQAEKEAEAKLGLSAYQLLSMEVADIPPGSEGLLVLPYFAGERAPIWDARARGLILGLTLSHTRRHIYRALLEATALGLRHGLDEQLAAGAHIDRIISTGGGTKSRVWTQIVSDVIGYDQDVLTHPYGAPYGDAFQAGMAVGLFKDMSPLHDVWVQETVPVKWNPEHKKVYDRYFEVYRGLYGKLKDDMHALAGLQGEKG